METYLKCIFIVVVSIFAILLLILIIHPWKKSTPKISKSSLTTSADDSCKEGCINGNCSKNKCICNSGWSGVDCNTKLPKGIKLQGYVYNGTECLFQQDCSSGKDICWADKETCDNNNATKPNYIYYDTNKIAPKSKSTTDEKNWGPDGVVGYCVPVTKESCKKGLNNGGYKADGNLALSDKESPVCYADNEDGIARCLSDFYSNTTITNNENKPAYWIRTTNNYDDYSCEKVAKTDEYCCSRNEIPAKPNCDRADYCGTSPGVINHEYTKGSMIFRDSCFIGKDACEAGKHVLAEQDVPSVEPVPKCINGRACIGDDCSKAKNCPTIPAKDAADCKSKGDETIWNFLVYPKAPGKPPTCTVEADSNTRTYKWVNGICYNTNNTSPTMGCTKVNDKGKVNWASKEVCLQDQKLPNSGVPCGGGCYSSFETAMQANSDAIQNFKCAQEKPK